MVPSWNDIAQQRHASEEQQQRTLLNDEYMREGIAVEKIMTLGNECREVLFNTLGVDLFHTDYPVDESVRTLAGVNDRLDDEMYVRYFIYLVNVGVGTQFHESEASQDLHQARWRPVIRGYVEHSVATVFTHVIQAFREVKGFPETSVDISEYPDLERATRNLYSAQRNLLKVALPD